MNRLVRLPLGACLSFALVGHLVHAQAPKPAAPKTETTQVAAKKPALAVLPRTVFMKDMSFENMFAVDAAKGRLGEFTYTLPEPAFVKVRVLRMGTRELFLASIVDFEYREAGTHTEVWDGRDYWGRPVDFTKTPYLIVTQTESVAAPDLSSSGIRVPDPIGYRAGETQESVIQRTSYPGRHLHSLHDRTFEQVPLLNVTSPTPNQVLTGRVAIKASVDEKRRAYGDRYGYGVRYYVDDQIVHEEFYKPESGGRFSYELDTTAFDDGRHLLYVGLCDHNDHVTSEGFAVVIKNSSR